MKFNVQYQSLTPLDTKDRTRMTRTQGLEKPLTIGRRLAREIYDWDFKELMAITSEKKVELQRQYPGLSSSQIDDIILQVQKARQVEVQRVGWLALPHDLTVIVTAVLTALVGWKVGVVGYVAALILFESIAQFTFSPAVYKPLSFAVWLTYPAYMLTAYSLYVQGFSIWQVALGTTILWAGTFFLGALARLPSRMILQNLSRSRAEYRRRKTGKE